MSIFGWLVVCVVGLAVGLGVACVIMCAAFNGDEGDDE